MKHFFIILQILGFFQSCLSAGWDYGSGPNGPDSWWNMTGYELCNDTLVTSRQSPIDMASGITSENIATPFVFTGLDDVNKHTLVVKNNGHTVQADITIVSGQTVTVTGGGLSGTFIPAQFHFHWGSVNGQGSEHTVAATKYPLEMHLVTYNNKYADIGTALVKTDGLAVLGFLFELDSSNNPDYTTLLSKFSEVVNKDSVTSSFELSVQSLLGDTAEFYRYSGSLTTPGCYESVTWTLFKKPIKMSSSQIQTFRTLKDTNGATLQDNYRPVQDVHTRVVKLYKYTSASAQLVTSNVLIFMIVAFQILWKL